MKALYRKYRPTSLSEVVCEPQVVEPLQNAITSGRFSHAYLFTGPRGTGKTSCARIFAHAINDFPYEIEDSYVDIIEIDAASNTGVDNIRDLREKSIIAPTEGKYKVYIIDEVHMLSKSAFNALLKTLEEPPEHVIFLLATTDIEKVPITITSRVQIFTFHLASPEEMLPHLRNICDKESIQITDDALGIVIDRGGGSFRDTLSLLDQISTLKSGEITADDITAALGLPTDALISDLLDAFSSYDLARVTGSLRSALDSGAKAETIAELLVQKILRSPTPDTIRLLSRLTSVRGDFPEAKLLVALTAEIASRPSPVLVSQRTTEVSTSSMRDALVQKVQRVTSTTVVENTTAPTVTTIPAASVAPQTSETTSAPEPSPVRGSFDFDSYFTSVKKSSIGAAMWLKKCQHSFENGTLHLYPDTATTKGIIESANNRRILMTCLGTYVLEIHDPGESPNSPKNTRNDSSLDLINGIMGETKEVIDGGESPF